MNILHLAYIATHCPNGPTVSVPNLANSLTECGHRVAILPSMPLKGTFKTSNPAVTLLPPPLKKCINPWSISDEWLSLVEKHFGRPDIVNIHGIYIPFQAAFALQAAKKRNWAFIVTPRGSFRLLAQKIKPLKKVAGNMLFANSLMNNASAIHALTQEEANEISMYFPKKKVFIVPNGVSKDLCETIQSIAPIAVDSLPKRAFVLSFLGRISIWIKGLDLLLEALGIVEKKAPNLDIRLLFIGSYYRHEDAVIMKNLLVKLKHPERIVFLGARTGIEKWSYLLRSNAFVHTSRFEGMSNSVLEAMAIGKACLLTPGTNMQDIIEKSNGGWVVAPNPEAIAEKLVFMVNHQDEVFARGGYAKEYVKRHLTWNQVAKNYVSELEMLLKPPITNGN